MHLKQAKGSAKQWWSMKHHGVNITTPTPLQSPSPHPGLAGSLSPLDKVLFIERENCLQYNP